MRLPPEWFYLSCDEAADRVQVPTQVDERIVAEPAMARFRDALVNSLASWSATATRSGSACAAFRCGMGEGGDAGEMVLATMTLEMLERDPGPPGEELVNLRPLVERQIDSDEYPPQVTEVDLGIGRALRMQAVRGPDEAPGQAGELRLSVDFWAPVADAVTLLFRFGSGALGHAGLLCEEFDTIATAFSLGSDNPP